MTECASIMKWLRIRRNYLFQIVLNQLIVRARLTCIWKCMTFLDLGILRGFWSLWCVAWEGVELATHSLVSYEYSRFLAPLLSVTDRPSLSCLSNSEAFPNFEVYCLCSNNNNYKSLFVILLKWLWIWLLLNIIGLFEEMHQSGWQSNQGERSSPSKTAPRVGVTVPRGHMYTLSGLTRMLANSCLYADQVFTAGRLFVSIWSEFSFADSFCYYFLFEQFPFFILLLMFIIFHDAQMICGMCQPIG